LKIFENIRIFLQALAHLIDFCGEAKNQSKVRSAKSYLHTINLPPSLKLRRDKPGDFLFFNVGFGGYNIKQRLAYSV